MCTLRGPMLTCRLARHVNIGYGMWRHPGPQLAGWVWSLAFGRGAKSKLSSLSFLNRPKLNSHHQSVPNSSSVPNSLLILFFPSPYWTRPALSCASQYVTLFCFCFLILLIIFSSYPLFIFYLSGSQVLPSSAFLWVYSAHSRPISSPGDEVDGILGGWGHPRAG